jgi:hypothetical protein
VEYNGGTLLDRQEILKGRQTENDEALRVYFECVVANQVGKRQWNQSNVECLPCDIATESDEAMGLLLLENSWDKWMNEFAEDKELLRQNDGVLPKLDRRKIPYKHVVGTLYTNNGSDAGGRYSGWTTEGKKRYNEYFEKVEKDRQELGFKDKQYLDGVRAKKIKKRPKVTLADQSIEPQVKIRRKLPVGRGKARRQDSRVSSGLSSELSQNNNGYCVNSDYDEAVRERASRGGGSYFEA